MTSDLAMVCTSDIQSTANTKKIWHDRVCNVAFGDDHTMSHTAFSEWSVSIEQHGCKLPPCLVRLTARSLL